MDKEVRVYRPDEKIAAPDFHIGRVIRAMLNPEYRCDLNDNEKRAINTGQDSSGGLLVAEDFSPAFIAPLRDATVIARTMRTLDMPRLNKTLVGIDTDATATAKRELKTLDEANITFHGIQLKGHKVGAYVKVSDENLMASNAADLIRDSLLYAVARKVDYYAIHGVGGEEPEGLENISGIHSSAAIGALTFDVISAEIYDLKKSSAPEPFQCFYATNVGGFLDLVQNATDKSYVSDDKLPRSWVAMDRRDSGILNDGYMVFGSFRQHGYVAYGGSWKIEISNAASDGTTYGFTDGVTFVRIMGWVDIAYAQPAAFQVLSGITSVSDLA